MQEKTKKKAVTNNNRDIEAFIASSPVKTVKKKTILNKNFPIKASPNTMSSSKGSSHKGGASTTIHQSSPRQDINNNQAMKTMVAFKKDNPEPLITTSKFPDKS